MPAALGKSPGAPAGAAALGVAAALPAAITVGASPFTYTAGANVEQVFIQHPASSTTTIARRGVGISNAVQPAASASTVCMLLGPGESIVVTYSVLPVMVRDTP